MPLLPGKQNIGRNISELHKGPNYARTEEKHGKAVADRQAVAIAEKKADDPPNKSDPPKGGHMAVLSAADRKSLPKKDFAGSGDSFPIEDKTHAREAISGATRSEHAGNISSSEEASIKAKARAKLGDGDADDPAKGQGDAHAKAKAAVAKMHPTHVHKLIQDAHSGKFGPEAQQTAQQAMQGGSPAETGDAPAQDAPDYSSMFSGRSSAPAQPAQQSQPGDYSSMFSGRR